ncbi:MULTISPECIES: hypothetical protein [Comamonas]|uniref:hypothetical protein n=1 Tax=Comamonas TaxID=283 RepID=UPI00257CC3BE|nr:MULTISPECIES: hypothetical protein [Comamonas]
MQQYEVYNALRSMKRLQKAHKTFLDALAAQPEVESDLGTVQSTSEGVSLQCLGYDVAIRQRPISLQAGELAYEYEFIVECWGEKHVIMRLYMTTQGNLYRAADLSEYFDSVDGWSTRNTLITETFIKLLQSKVFAPNQIKTSPVQGLSV